MVAKEENVSKESGQEEFEQKTGCGRDGSGKISPKRDRTTVGRKQRKPERVMQVAQRFADRRHARTGAGQDHAGAGAGARSVATALQAGDNGDGKDRTAGTLVDDNDHVVAINRDHGHRLSAVVGCVVHVLERGAHVGPVRVVGRRRRRPVVGIRAARPIGTTAGPTLAIEGRAGRWCRRRRRSASAVGCGSSAPTRRAHQTQVPVLEREPRRTRRIATARQ